MAPDISASQPPFWTVIFAGLALPLAPLVMASLALRERWETRRTRRLLDSQRRVPGEIAQQKCVARSLAATAEGRPIEAWDVLTWAGIMSLALLALVASALAGFYLVGQWLPAAAPVILFAWWLELRRRGVRAASVYPSAIWALAMASIVAIYFWHEEVVVPEEPLLSYRLWWLGFAWPTQLVAAIAAAVAAAATLALVLRRHVAPFAQPILWVAGILSAAAVWSTMSLGGYFMLLAAIIAAYGIARGARQTLDYAEYARIVRTSAAPLPLDVERRRGRLDLSPMRVEISKVHVAAAGALGLVTGLARVAVDLDDAVGIWLLLVVAGAAAIWPVLASVNRHRLVDPHALAGGALAAYVALCAHVAVVGLGSGRQSDLDLEFGNLVGIAQAVAVGSLVMPLFAVVRWFGRDALRRWGALILSLSFIPIPLLVFLPEGSRGAQWWTFALAAVCLLGAMALAFGPPRLERSVAASETRGEAELGDAADAAALVRVAR